MRRLAPGDQSPGGPNELSFLNLLQKQVTVARVFGIPVRVDYRWFFIFVVTVWLMSENISAGVAELGKNASLALGIIATLAYFLSIFGHEMAHAWAAKLEGIETLEIVLHPFGGLARLSREPETPKSEFRIGLAGPVASFLFAGLFFGIAILIDSFRYRAGTPFTFGLIRAGAASFFLIGFGNLLLAVFNLFPGYPLDGGRVLRAFLWRRNGDMNRSTLIAGRAGQIIAIAFGALGLFIAAVRHDLFTGIWTVLVGVFLFDAALK
ncbi:MAG: site-2 protease family protein, partial [Pyrinomonadaceae bacterium]